MSNKTKRFCVSFSQEDIKELEFLSKSLGESKNQILRRALILLHHVMTTGKEPKNAGINIV